MRILLSTSEDAFISHEYGKTWAEKKSRFQAKCNIDHFLNYFTVMNGYDGKWVEVDTTKYLFTHSFNAIMDDNGLYDVQHNYVLSIDLSPEFNSMDEWIDAVQKRYDKDWPGTDCVYKMSFWESRIYPKQFNPIQI